MFRSIFYDVSLAQWVIFNVFCTSKSPASWGGGALARAPQSAGAVPFRSLLQLPASVLENIPLGSWMDASNKIMRFLERSLCGLSSWSEWQPGNLLLVKEVSCTDTNAFSFVWLTVLYHSSSFLVPRSRSSSPFPRNPHPVNSRCGSTLVISDHR
jgi:hypothetical protein